jgi:hypothetical protein
MDNTSGMEASGPELCNKSICGWITGDDAKYVRIQKLVETPSLWVDVPILEKHMLRRLKKKRRFDWSILGSGRPCTVSWFDSWQKRSGSREARAYRKELVGRPDYAAHMGACDSRLCQTGGSEKLGRQLFYYFSLAVLFLSPFRFPIPSQCPENICNLSAKKIDIRNVRMFLKVFVSVQTKSR